MTITALGWRIHLDALLARLLYRWWWWSLPLTLLTCLWCSVGAGLVRPFWKTAVPVTIAAPAGATVAIDGVPWQPGQPVYAGRRTVQATTAAGVTTLEVQLTADVTETLTLPAPLAAPTLHPLPPPAPGYVRETVRWADGAWRLTSHRAPPPPATAGPLMTSPTPLPRTPGPTLAMNGDTTTRLVDVDAFGGLADRRRSGAAPVDVVYRPQTARGDVDGGGSVAAGTIEIRGWGAAPISVPVTDTVTMVALAPSGHQVLLATNTPQGGVQLWRVTEQRRILAPLLAVPGRLVSWSWAPDETVLVVETTTAESVVLTLVRVDDGLPSVVADVPLALLPAGRLPQAWSAAGVLWWLAPGGDGMQLWQVTPATLLPTAAGALDGLALTVRPDGAVWALQRTAAGTLQVAQWADAQPLAVIGTVPQVVTTAAWGVWQADEVVIVDGTQGWLVRLVPAPGGGSK